MPRTAARVLLVLTLAAASAWGSVVKATEQPKDAIIELQEIVEKCGLPPGCGKISPWQSATCRTI